MTVLEVAELDRLALDDVLGVARVAAGGDAEGEDGKRQGGKSGRANLRFESIGGGVY